MSRVNRFGTRKKTVTRTFRIRKAWDDVLQEEAVRQGVSVNVMLNKLLRKYSLYSRWSNRKKDISFPRRTLRELLKISHIESLAEAGTKLGAVDAVNMAKSMGLTLNYESFIYLITEHLGGPHFARWFQCFYHTQGDKDIFHLQHDLGPEWSVFLEKYILSFLLSMTDTKATTRVYDYAVTLEARRPKSKTNEHPR